MGIHIHENWLRIIAPSHKNDCRIFSSGQLIELALGKVWDHFSPRLDAPVSVIYRFVVSATIWRLSASGHSRRLTDRDCLVSTKALVDTSFAAAVMPIMAHTRDQRQALLTERVWTPPVDASRICHRLRACGQVLTCVRPQLRRSTCRGPLWKSADRVHYAYARSRRHSVSWFSRSRLLDRLP